MKGCILFVIALCFFGCSKDDPIPASTDDSPVYLAGVMTTATGKWVASYWENGVYSNLTNDTIISSRVNSLCVDGSSVLIGGVLQKNYYPQGVIWQNGKQTNIAGANGSVTLVASDNNNLFGVWEDDSLGWVINKNGLSQPILDTASSFPTAMTASEGDLFIAGNAKGYVGRHLDWSNMYVQCWKNDQLIFRESARSYVYSIFVHGNDVYMAGYLSTTNHGSDIACYWKNGQRVDLTDGNFESIARSIFVTDTNVYVSGESGFQAVYWKDGIVKIVAYGQSEANAIFVKGTDIYVAGTVGENNPAYWKNGIRQKISNQDQQGRIDFIVVGQID